MNDYKIIEILGQGGYGTVVKAEHILSKKIVAIKKIDKVNEDGFTRKILREIII